MTQNVPVTAPGSQGVFRGKDLGSKWALGNLLFLSWCLSCPVAGTSAQFSTCRKIQTIEFRDKNICLFGLKTSDNLNWFQEWCTGPHESENGPLVSWDLKRKTCGTSTLRWP
jgi:hypothetical protein